MGNLEQAKTEYFQMRTLFEEEIMRVLYAYSESAFGITFDDMIRKLVLRWERQKERKREGKIRIVLSRKKSEIYDPTAYTFWDLMHEFGDVVVYTYKIRNVEADHLTKMIIALRGKYLVYAPLARKQKELEGKKNV